MNGVHGRTHFELEQFIDMKSFDNIQLDIWKGIASAKPLALHGYLPDYLIYDPAVTENARAELTFRPIPDLTEYYEHISVRIYVCSKHGSIS